MKIELNLIPPSKKAEVQQAKYLNLVLRWGIKSGLVMVLLAAVLLFTEYLFKININVNESQRNMKSGEQIKEVKKYDAQAKEINTHIEEIEKLQNGQYFWSKFFIDLAQKVPADIEILSLNTKNLSVSLAGRAATRESLVGFKQKLEEDKCLEKVNLPLSDLVAKTDINFQIDFNLKDQCIKNE